MIRAEATEIHRCGRFLLRRQTIDGRTVVQKTVRGRRAAPGAAALLLREHAFLRRLDVPGVARPLALEGTEDAPVLVLEDAGPEDLERRIARGPLALDAFFEIAIALADTCARVHGRGVVHRAIAPGRVVLGADGQVTLVHLADAAELTSAPAAVDIDKLRALPFLSPEQLGRMDRFVDWRSDLYALGATFHAMLTGAPPFRDSDPLALVHAHMARSPPPAHVVCPHVPGALSEIVQRLLAKMPELRYQSADSLAGDLREARRRWSTAGAIARFELGRLDLAQRLPLPARLFGRERERAALRRALDRASGGATELALVTGEAGIGKTALVESLRDDVADRGGRFIEGKFDLRAANVPYSSVAEALAGLAAALGAEPEERRAELRAAVGEPCRALGAGAPVEITVARRDGTAELVVQDHGIGIPAERLPHVFERFERAVSSRHFGGLGLGLHVVKSIVEALGGAVRADSGPGEGTRITVELPCDLPAASWAEPAALGGLRP
ncbi:serine/threonine protein kinase [Sorangium sp. So ce1024]|uniref:serine/threonine protein kinase n=1 Tax=unclassified Sorangium TaxID=2621164 RepID=UPI003F00778F